MKLLKADIKAYRNLKEGTVEFTDGINVIWGDNAQGKTNLLEAIYVFARGKPYRMKKETDVIPFSESTAGVDIVYESFGREVPMSVYYRRGEKRKMKISGGEVTRASEFIGNFRAVMFCPDHLSIIKDSPSQRRLFLDVAISQTDKKYVYMLKKYTQILAQRAALIKDAAESKSTNYGVFDVLAQQIAIPCRYITERRMAYCEKLGEYMATSIDEMSEGKEKASAEYSFDTSLSEMTDEAFYKLFCDNIDKEIQYKMNLYGVQRDDIEIMLNGKSSRFYCSQGQQRSLSLAAKLAEGEIAKEETGEYPVYLFDDVLSELDSKRASYLLSKLGERQVIITSCNEELFSPFGVSNKINICSGRIK